MNNGNYEPNVNQRTNVEHLIEELRLNQNIVQGILGGLIGAILGAVLWAVITVITDYQIGWMAIGVGFLVGKLVSKLGKGVDAHFGVVGALFALLGCAMGNLFTVLYLVSIEEGIPLLDIIKITDLSIIIELFKLTFQPMDIFFYAIALYEGYKFSILTVKVEEITPLTGDNPN